MQKVPLFKHALYFILTCMLGCRRSPGIQPAPETVNLPSGSGHNEAETHTQSFEVSKIARRDVAWKCSTATESTKHRGGRGRGSQGPIAVPIQPRKDSWRKPSPEPHLGWISEETRWFTPMSSYKCKKAHQVFAPDYQYVFNSMLIQSNFLRDFL